MRLLLTGAAGQLGSEVAREVAEKNAGRSRAGIDLLACDRARLDITRRDEVMAAVCGFEPDVIVHPAAWTAVDACEADPDKAFLVNALGTRHLAEAARLSGAHLVYISTDYVFDGQKPAPYLEWDAPAPLSVYGRSKLGGEQELDSSQTIVRTAWVVGRTGANMAKTILRLGRETDGELRFVDDQRGCPTVAADLARKTLELAISRRPGIFHVTNQGPTTWYGFAREVMKRAGLDAERVVPVSTKELDPPRPAPRPANSVLDNAALRLAGESLLPDWRDSLDALLAELS